MTNIFNQSKEVYRRLQDEESKHIYCFRGLYSLTGDKRYIQKLTQDMPEKRYLDDAPDGHAYIFGCGCYGKVVYENLNKKWVAFSDNNQNLWGGGTKYCGLDVIPPHELPKDATVYLSVKWHRQEIKEQLLSYGLNESNIVDVAELVINLDRRQYFDLPFLPHDANEIFVDAGCLNGETTRNFIRWADNKYDHVYCFEPDGHNFLQCEENLQNLIDSGKVTVVNKALADTNGTATFLSLQNGNSKIGQGSESVETIALDSMLHDKRVTFIKMDLEGGEYQALLGAKKIISEQHPKLAISIYHLPSDITDIPALILSYYPDYKFYIRHYTPFEFETILYAI